MLPISRRTVARAGAAVLASAALGACGASAPSHVGGSKSSKKTAAAKKAAAKKAVTPDTLTIYSSLALQGQNESTNTSVNQAMQLALEQARGRVGKYAIRFIEVDNSIASTGQADPATAKQNATQAADDPSAIAYIGDDTSSATAASMPILNRAGILQVSPQSTANALTAGGNGNLSLKVLDPTGKRTFARVIPNDVVQANSQAEYQANEGCQSVFLITDGSVYGVTLTQGVDKADQAAGISIAGQHQVGVSQTDFGNVVNAVNASGADCVFYGGADNKATANMWQDLAKANPQIKLFGPDALSLAQFALDVGSYGNRTFITSPGLGPSAYNDLGQTFYSAFQARFGGFPSPYAIFGYEAMEAVLSSIANANSAGGVSKANVVKQFFDIRDRESVLGTYSIDANGDTTLDTYGAYRISEGSLIFDHLLEPVATSSGTTVSPSPST